MERWRVEDLAGRADVSVDTIRFYQKRRLLAPPLREGRVAWYGTEHLERLAPDPRTAARRPHPRADRAPPERRHRRHRPPARGGGGSRPTSKRREEFFDLARAGRAVGRSAAAARSRRTRRPAAPPHPRRRRVLHGAPTSRSCSRDWPCSNADSRCPNCSRSPAITTPRPREVAEQAVALFDEHVRATVAVRGDLPDDEKAEAARRGVPRPAADDHRARRAPLPARAARGRAGAPRAGRRGHRARGRLRRVSGGRLEQGITS